MIIEAVVVAVRAWDDNPPPMVLKALVLSTKRELTVAVSSFIVIVFFESNNATPL